MKVVNPNPNHNWLRLHHATKIQCTPLNVILLNP